MTIAFFIRGHADVSEQHMARVTLSQIAERAGVSLMTVSYALRGNPRISAETRGKVRRIADALGYRPDPAMAALVSHRQRARPKTDYSTLAFVSAWPKAEGWARYPTYKSYHEGAEERAAQLGYRVENFWLEAPDLSGRRASHILYSRGIRGLLLAPLPDGRCELSMEWQRFCAVGLGFSIRRPEVDAVGHHMVRGVTLAWRRLEELGYRRIALTLRDAQDDRGEHLWLAGFLQAQALAGPSHHRVPPLLAAEWTSDLLGSFLRTHRPDVLLSVDWDPYHIAKGLGYRTPQDIGFAVLDRGSHPGTKTFDVSGVDQQSREIGRKAVETLHLQMIGGGQGLPDHRAVTLLDGAWHEGVSLRRKSV